MSMTMNDVVSDCGYIYVASRQKIYYEFAIISCTTLKDIYPEANVTLFTHEAFVDKRALDLFDNVITGIPIHPRAKMWCMARTPYTYTFYNDVDSQIVHPDISRVFEPLVDSDADIYFTENFPYTVANIKWGYIDKDQKIPALRHGAVCCYKKSDLTIDFMSTWWQEYNAQVRQRNNWPYEYAHNEWWQFDMFTLWRILDSNDPKFDRFKHLKDIIGPKRFNCTIHDKGTKEEYGRQPPVVYQIDTGTYKDMLLYNDILKGVNDERCLPEQCEIRDDTLTYN